MPHYFTIAKTQLTPIRVSKRLAVDTKQPVLLVVDAQVGKGAIGHGLSS